MRIFSLRNKIALVTWAVLLGSVLNFIINTVTQKLIAACPAELVGKVCDEIYVRGFPIKSTIDIQHAYGDEFFPIIINWLFWVGASLVILYAVRFFRKKRNAITSKN